MQQLNFVSLCEVSYETTYISQITAGGTELTLFTTLVRINLIKEMYKAYQSGRAEKDPSEGWHPKDGTK
jgi:hypothetical protein